jgi:hypothetical protein
MVNMTKESINKLKGCTVLVFKIVIVSNSFIIK